MKSARTIRSVLQAALLTCCLSACGEKPQSATLDIDPRLIVTPPPGISDDTETKLYTVRGLNGLIEHGDELMVMIYGHDSREAVIRSKNIAVSQSSLTKWLAMGNGDQTLLNGRFLRVPDLDDKSGSRFYYFQRTAPGNWNFLGICTGGWDDDPAWPPICHLTYSIGQKTLSIELTEPDFLRNHDPIIERVLSRLAAEGVLEKY